MGLKYQRFGAVALTTGLLLSMAGAGSALAADPPANGIVFDGVVKALWMDRADGVMAGAGVRVFYYRDGDPIHAILAGSWTTDENGLATITGVPRALPGTEPVRLDIRADRSAATDDAVGCITYQDWIAQSVGVMSRPLILLILRTSYASEPFVNCPVG